MTEIESPLGKQSYGSASPRVLKVDDPTMNQSYQGQLPQQTQQPRELTESELRGLEQQRVQAHMMRERVSPQAKSRLEYLAGIGRIRDDFEVDGVKFSLQSLKSGALEEILDAAINLGENISAGKFNLEIRKQTLARSLYAIDNLPIEEVIGSNNFKDKLLLIEEFDENIVELMHKKYQKNIINVANKKFAIKDEKDAQEVIEDIKK